MQALNEIIRQERAVTRNTENPSDAAPLFGQPVQPSKDSGQRAGEIWNAIRNDRQPCIGKPLWVAVGIDDDARALRRQSRQHTVENGHAADFDARLVAAARAPSKSAREDQATRRWVANDREQQPCADAWRFRLPYGRDPGRRR